MSAKDPSESRRSVLPLRRVYLPLPKTVEQQIADGDYPIVMARWREEPLPQPDPPKDK